MLRRLGFLAVIAGLTVCRSAAAATSHEITITVQIEYLAVAVSPTGVDFGMLAADHAAVGTKLDVTNTGNVPQNVGLRITDESDPDGWSAATAIDGNGENVYVLGAIAVSDGGAAAEAGNYGNDDVVRTTKLYWKTDAGAAAGSQLVAEEAQATPVAAGAAKDLFFMIKTPTLVSGANAGEPHEIKVELSVTAD